MNTFNSQDNPSFFCPITNEMMSDPVIDSEGNTFERGAIEEWLRSDGTSPLTRSPMNIRDLRPNRALKDAIDREYESQTGSRPSFTPYVRTVPPDVLNRNNSAWRMVSMALMDSSLLSKFMLSVFIDLVGAGMTENMPLMNSSHISIKQLHTSSQLVEKYLMFCGLQFQQSSY